MFPSASPGREEGQRADVGVKSGAEELALYSLAQRAQRILHHQLHIQLWRVRVLEPGFGNLFSTPNLV